MQSTTFPEDDLRRFIQQIARSSGFLESVQRSHEHAGVRLSVSETFALGELAEAGALSQQELAARLGLEKSTVSRLAAGMEERGWLQPRARRRRPAPLPAAADRATGGTSPTAWARSCSEHHGRLLARLSPEERHALGVGLGALVRELDATHRRT